jgi:hypothetical protein
MTMSIDTVDLSLERKSVDPQRTLLLRVRAKRRGSSVL